MSRLVKILVREFILRTPFLRDEYFEWEFLRREQSFRGVYPSFASAQADAPEGALLGYDHKEVAHFHEAELDHLHPSDYPMLFWLSSLLPQVRNVFDFGGNLGVAYYAYRHYLTFPGDLRWTVCEVPATVDAGRELAQKRNAPQLAFTDRRDKAAGADVYFSCGALQYIEEPFADMLKKLGTRPRHVLINRVPLTDDPTFITLQNNGKWIVPYKVANKAAFIEGVTALGYDLVDQWKTPRSLHLLMSRINKGGDYQGMYFRAK